MMCTLKRKMTGTLKATNLDYFLETEDAEIFLLNVSHRHRRLVGCEVVVKGTPTGLYMLRVETIALAP